MGAGRFPQGGFPPGTLPSVTPSCQRSVRKATPAAVGNGLLPLLAAGGSAVLVFTAPAPAPAPATTATAGEVLAVSAVASLAAAFRALAHHSAPAARDRLQIAVKPGNPLHRVPPPAAGSAQRMAGADGAGQSRVAR